MFITRFLSQNIFMLCLFFLVILTHGNHELSAVNLPPATWFAFFAIGAYSRSFIPFLALSSAILFLDFSAIHWQNISDFCVSLAYPILFLAYGILWKFGRLSQNILHNSTSSLSSTQILALLSQVGLSSKHQKLSTQGAFLMMAGILAEFVSSGGFYILSGYFSPITTMGFLHRFIQYAPQSLLSLLFWGSLYVLLHPSFERLNALKFR